MTTKTTRERYEEIYAKAIEGNDLGIAMAAAELLSATEKDSEEKNKE